MNIGIKEYHTLLGKNMRSVDDIAKNVSLQTKDNIKASGLVKVPTDNEQLLLDMIKEVYSKFKEKVDLIIVAHSIPFINNNLNNISSHLNGNETLILSGMPCAIFHEAVSLAKNYIAAQEYEKILVIGADKAYSDEERIFFNTIMGDCVIGLVLENNCISDRIVSSHIQSTIIAPEGELSGGDKIKKYRMISTPLIKKCIETCLSKSNLDLDMISHIVPHTPNKKLWDTVSEYMQIDRKLFRDDHINRTGHFNSNDSFYHYVKLREENSIKKGEYSLLVNPGFGGSQGCTLIKA